MYFTNCTITSILKDENYRHKELVLFFIDVLVKYDFEVIKDLQYDNRYSPNEISSTETAIDVQKDLKLFETKDVNPKKSLIDLFWSIRIIKEHEIDYNGADDSLFDALERENFKKKYLEFEKICNSLLITIPKEKCIPEEFSLEIRPYTILAGENNSGKTTILKIIDNLKLHNLSSIFVPSTMIDASSQVNTSVKTSPFSLLMKEIISKFLDEIVPKNIAEKFEENEIKNNFEKEVNSFLRECEVTDSEFKLKLNAENFTEEEAKKLVKPFILDLTDENKEEEVDINSLGQGIQRLIIVALIKSYSKIGDKKFIFLFDEPETFLHPKLKLKLHEYLKELSRDHFVVISTHDPYFIELGENEIIYKIDRTAKNYCEKIELNFLDYRSHSEINYKIFGILSKTYFLELYEYLLTILQKKGVIEFEKKAYEKARLKKADEKEISSYGLMNIWLRKNGAKIADNDPKKPQISKIRHSFGHPKEKVVGLTKEDIDELQGFITLTDQEANSHKS